MSKIAGQPPPVENLTSSNTSTYIEVSWELPTQIPTAITSSIAYNTLQSPASEINEYSQNMILFPIVNRIVMKLTEINATTGEDIQVVDYPLYALGGTNTTSTVDSDAYVIYPKGSELTVHDSDDSTRTTYTSNTTVINQHLLSNMPTKIRLYRSVPSRAQRQTIIQNVDSNTIIPFSSDEVGSILNFTEYDYKISIWLENNSSDTAVKVRETTNSFLFIASPEAPQSAEFKLSDVSSSSVSTANSQGHLEIVDPEYAVGSSDIYDSTINFQSILFEWSDDNFASNVYTFAKVRHDASNPTDITHNDAYDESLSEGILSINRGVDDLNRKYSFDLTEEYLGSNWNSVDVNSTIQLFVRISYTNGANTEFGPTSEPSQLSIGVPNTPAIRDIELSSGQNITITLVGTTDANVVIASGVTSENVSVNTNHAVFIKEIDLQAEYELDNGSVVEYESFGNVDYTYNGTTSSASQGANTTYTFTLPDGLPSGIFADDLYSWRFKVKVKNNLVNVFSQMSQITGGSGVDSETQIDGTAAQSFSFSKISGGNVIDESDYDATNYRISVDWQNPGDGDRGVPADKSATNLPNVYKNEIRLEIGDETLNRVITTESYEEDVHTSGSAETFDVYSAINNVSATYNTAAYDTQIESNDAFEQINVTVGQKTHYIDTYDNITTIRYYSLRNPDGPESVTVTPTIYTGEGFNRLSLNWSKPNFQGFRYGTNADLTSSDNKEIDVNRYIVSVTANVSTSDAPYLNSIASSNTSVQNTIDTVLPQDDARTNMLNIQYNSSLDNTTGSSDSVGDVFTHPETSYIVEIKSRNAYGLTTNDNTNPLYSVSQKTGIPGEYWHILDNPPVPNDADLESLSYYATDGFTLDTSDYDNVTAHQPIANTVEITLDTQVNKLSTQTTHLMNQGHMMNYQSSYITNVSNQKFRQLIIKNEAGGQPIELLRLGVGDAVNFNQFERSVNTSNAWASHLILSSFQNRDVYDNTGFDIRNSGYWWQEDIQTGANISSGFEYSGPVISPYTIPHKLVASIRYSKLDNFANASAYSASNLSVDGDCDIVNATMLLNSHNTDSYAYFDNLTTGPSLAQRSSADYITTVNNTNYINGIPNLFPLNENVTYSYRLNYTLEGFSQHYGLDSTQNFTSHSLRSQSNTSAILISNTESRNWSSKTNCTRAFSSWDVENITITDTTLGFGSSLINTTYTDIGIYVDAKNTKESDTAVLAGYGDLYNFIYDRNSVDIINGTSTILTVEDGFNPNATAYSNATANTTTYNWYGVDENGDAKNGRDALFVVDGRFVTESSTYLGFDSIIEHKENYGIDSSIPQTPTDGVRWSVFKYETAEFVSTTTTKMFYFNFGSGTNLTIEDVVTGNTSANDDMSENCRIYAQIELHDPHSDTTTPLTYVSGSVQKKWVRYSGPYYSTTTLSAANLEALDARVETYDHSLQWNNPTTDLNWLDTDYIPGGGSAPTSHELRTCWGLFNKLTVPSGSQIRIYLAVGLKQTVDRNFTKPTSVTFLQSGTELSTQVEFTAT